MLEYTSFTDGNIDMSINIYQKLHIYGISFIEINDSDEN